MTKPNGAADAAADDEPSVEDGADTSAAPQTPPAQAADDMPGAPVRGYPGVRAGVPGAAKRDLGEAQTIGTILDWGGGAQTLAGAAKKGARDLGAAALAKSLGALAGEYTGAAGWALGRYMGAVEAPRLQKKIEHLQETRKKLGLGEA
jgi:hypothetical protein